MSGGLLPKIATDAWKFLKDLSEKTIQWETAKDDSFSFKLIRRGIYAVSDVNNLESNIVVLEKMIKGLLVQQPQSFQDSLVSCSDCHALEHTLSSYPYFAHQLSIDQEHVNKAYQRPKQWHFFPLL